jgi:chromosomal replication initiation ATPase DnaA
MRFVTPDVEVGHPAFGTAVRCPMCGGPSGDPEFRARQQRYLAEVCGLEGEAVEWTFANTKRLPGNAAAYDELLRRSKSPAWLVGLRGAYGTGKTRLLAATVNAGREQGFPSVYTTMGGLLSHLRRAIGREGPLSYDGLAELVGRCTILCLDEVDRIHATGWAEQQLFELIDRRYRAGRERLTVLATNAPWEELAGYLASRLGDTRCARFEISGGDKRGRGEGW